MSRIPAMINYLELLYSVKVPSKNDDVIGKYLINISHIILVQLKEFMNVLIFCVMLYFTKLP